MNRNMVYVILLVLGLIMATSYGMGLSLLTDLDIERQEAEQWIDQNEEKIITYLEETDFPKPTEKSEEVYELKLKNGTTKLKGYVNWTERDIELLDIDSEKKADATLLMRNGTYQKAIERFMRAVEEGEPMSGTLFYLETLTTSSVELRGENGFTEMSYKIELTGWMNSARKNIEEDR